MTRKRVVDGLPELCKSRLVVAMLGICSLLNPVKIALHHIMSGHRISSSFCFIACETSLMCVDLLLEGDCAITPCTCSGALDSLVEDVQHLTAYPNEVYNVIMINELTALHTSAIILVDSGTLLMSKRSRFSFLNASGSEPDHHCRVMIFAITGLWKIFILLFLASSESGSSSCYMSVTGR